MKDSKSLIIGITGSMVAGTIYLIERHVLPSENSLNNIGFYKKYPLSTSILIFLVIYLSAPYIIRKIIIKYKNYKDKIYKNKKSRLTKIFNKYYKEIYIKELSNTTRIEKDILLFYYIEPNELCHKFDENFTELKTVYNLCDKGLLYKPYKHNDFLHVDDHNIEHYKICMKDKIKNYLDKHRKILK